MAEAELISILSLNPELLQTASTTVSSALEALPGEILTNILCHCTATARINLARTSKHQAKVSQGPNILSFNVDKLSQLDIDTLQQLGPYNFELQKNTMVGMSEWMRRQYPQYHTMVRHNCTQCEFYVDLAYDDEERPVYPDNMFMFMVEHMSEEMNKISELDLVNWRACYMSCSTGPR